MPRFVYIKLVLLLLITCEVSAQNRFWVQSSAWSCKASLGDPDFCSELTGYCSTSLTKSQQAILQSQGIEIQPVLTFEYRYHESQDSPTLGFALEQIEAHLLINQGLNGEGVKIGIIDGGFLNAQKDPSLKYFFDEELVKSYEDYVTPEMKPYDGAKGLDDQHGTEVWQLIGGYNPQKGIQYGLATRATYYLARTDHGAYERRVEEDHMIAALESMAKKGVKLINISLGYNIGFNDPKENYQPHQMDGKTSMIAQVVDKAVTKKGMLIVVAAGNEGKISWQTLSTPGDAKYAFTVGSSKLKVWDKMNYSSIGPDYTDFVKPDVSVHSTLGTSFASPIITGLIACIWQKDPSLTNFEMMDLVRSSGHLYPFPNNYLGYGVPTAGRILQIMKGEPPKQVPVIEQSKNTYTLQVDNDEIPYVVAFHKTDSTHIINRVMYRNRGKKIKIKKDDLASQTTLLVGQEAFEVFWK